MKRQKSEQSVETWSGNAEFDAAEWAPAQARDTAVPVTKRILIVGAGETGRILAEQLKRRPGYHVVGFIEDDAAMAASLKDSILGGHDDVLRVVDEHSVDEVVVAYAPSWQQRVAESLVNGHSHLRVHVVPTLYETMIAKPEFQTISDVPLIHLHAPTGLSYPSRILKRGFDIFVSLLILLVSSPVDLLVMLGIKLTSRGPILISQERVGRNGRLFRCLKFRTMVSNAEASTGPVLSSGKADARVTPFGRLLRKTRVDEIPQFLNVLLGHMSVVGPRPERTVFVEKFRAEVTGYDERHKVRPGITGLAQVHGYYLTDVHTKLRYDMLYVYNQSLLLDTKILVQTFREMFNGSGS
ncbi:MAG TPA: sugar transferase [Armatimonadota bacterium]|jgi:exopolysaccharide biosynthesis polyprenyl glycosylphosphotransferase